MPGEIVVGAVAVDIVPSAKNFLARLAKDIAPGAAAAGKAAGEAIEKEVADGAADGVKKGLADGKRGAKKDGAEAGGEFSGGFAAAVRAGLKAAQSAIGDFKVPVTLETDLTSLGEARVELDKLKAEIKRIGDVDVDANLDDALFLAKLAHIKKELRTLSASSADLGFGSEVRSATKAVDGLVEKIQSANTKTGAFARNVDAFYKGILGTFADTDFDVDARFVVSGTGEIDAAGFEVDRLRKKVAQFRTDNAKGILDGAAVKKQIAEISADMERLGKMPLGENLAYEFGKVKQATAAIAEDLFGIKAEKVEVEADTKPATVELEGLARTLQQFAAKAAKMVTIRPDLDDDQIYPELAKVKAAFSDIEAKVGVEYDDNEGLLQARALQAVLNDLSRKHTANFGVSSDLKTLSESLDKFLGDIDKSNVKLEGLGATLRKVAQQAAGKITIRTDLDNDAVYGELAALKADLKDIVVRVGIDMPISEALTRMQYLETRLKLLTRKRSIDVVVNREVLDVASVFNNAQRALNGATEAGTGFLDQLSKMTPVAAAANVAFVGVFAALPAIIAVAAAAIAGLLGLLTAVAGLAVTAGLGLAVLMLALTPIIAAIKAQKNATQQAAQATLDAAQAEQTALSNRLALASADRAVASAETTLARARLAATKQVAQSARSLAGAQRNLTIANDKEKDARKKLSQSYVDAKKDLKDLNAEIRKNRIEQQAQIVSINGARIALNALAYDPTASGQDIAEAQAKVATEQQKLRDLQADQAKNLATQSKGVAGDPGVISAQAELKTAIESVKDAQDSVATAAENAAQAQIDAAQSVNDAEKALAQARTDRANTAEQQRLAATVAAAQKTASTSTQDDPMTKLTQKGLEFVTFYEQKIKPIVDKFFQTAQDSGILSGIEGFMDAIRPSLGPLNKLITAVGHSMGVMFIQIGNFLGSKEGTDFIDFLTKNAPKGFEILAQIAKVGLGFVFKLFEKFGPVMDKLAPVLSDVLADIGDILIEFLESDDFKDLIQTMIDNLPLILYTVLDLLIAFAKMIPVLAPLGEIILFVIDQMLIFFNSLSTGTIQAILASVLIVIGTIIAAAGSVVTIVVAVVLAIIGIVIGLTYVWKHWDQIWGWIKGVFWDFIHWFTDGWSKVFDDAWSTLKRWGQDIADFWTNWIVEPIEHFLSWFTDGWRHVFSDAWDQIVQWGRDIRGFWDDLVAGIGRIWGGLRNLLSTPINGVIHLVNDYLIKGFNAVSSIVHGPHLDPIDELPVVRAARGTIVPGYQSSMRDEVPAMLRKGEGVLVPEVVREIGPSTILEWNRRANLGQRILPFAYGGLVDQIVAFERKSQVPFNVTSGVRNSNDYHGRGMAVDTASTALNMQRLASWLYGYSPYLLELIHSGGPGYFVKNGDKVGASYYRTVVAEHYSHVHTAMNEAGLLAVQEGAKPADGDAEEPTGLAATLIGRLQAKVKEGIAKAIGKIRDTTLGKIAIGMSDTLLGGMGTTLIGKAQELASAVTGVVGDVSGFIKSLFTEEKPSAHEKGDMASPITAASYAKSQLKNFGWDSTDMEYLAKLWNGESGWRWNAKNPSSGAYGIPQSLPGTKMGSVGADWATNAFTQVLWGMGYIKDRYEDPTNAYLTWLGRTPHWYDTGGYLPPGLTLAYNGTGRNERVMTHDQEQDMMRERAALLQGGVDVNVRVHDHAVPGLVSVELDRQFGALADSYVYGVPQ